MDMIDIVHGLSGDFTENSEDYGVYRFKRGFNVYIEGVSGISINQLINLNIGYLKH